MVYAPERGPASAHVAAKVWRGGAWRQQVWDGAGRGLSGELAPECRV